MPTPRRILRKPEVREATGLSDSQIWRKANAPDDAFPAPISLGPNAVGWFADEIAEWQANRPRGFGQSKPHLGEHYERGAKNSNPADAAA